MTGLSEVTGFRHEAVLYAGDDEFVERIAPFVLDGIAAHEPTLVMVNERRIKALRDRLGDVDGSLVDYRDMEAVGANPARIIPAWDDFATARTRDGALRLRGVGEPIWPGRTPAQLTECHWHEALINRAFAEVPGFWLVCPYDIAGLDASVVHESRRTHPVVSEPGCAVGDGIGADGWATMPQLPLASALPQPLGTAAELSFDSSGLAALRSLVAAEAARGGLSPSQLDDLVLSVNEVATNSVTHGGGNGVARVWREAADFVCEIRDAGVITDPLADRRGPGADPVDSRGLWTVNQLCDLVQVRSSPETGSVVRLLVHTAGGWA